MYHSRFIIACMFALTCGAVPMIVHATNTIPDYHSFKVTGDEKTYCCCKRKRSELCRLNYCDKIDDDKKEEWAYQTKGTVIHNDVNNILNNESYEDSFITCNDGVLAFKDRKYYSDNDYGLKDGEINGGEHDVYFFDLGSKKLYPEESGFCQPAMGAVLLRACKAGYILDDESGCQSITDVNVKNKMCKQNKAHTFINKEDKILTYRRHQLDEYCISGTHCVYETSGNYFNCGEGRHETIDDCTSSDCPDGDCKVELYTKDGNPFIYNTQTILKEELGQFCLYKKSHTDTTRSEHLNDLKEQCRRSGGTWNKDAKSCSCHHYPNMVLDGTKCRCADYHRRTDLSDISQGCTRQDMDQQNCVGDDKQWLESSATCKCKAEGYYYNIDTYECDPLTDYTLCSYLGSQATWEPTNKKCVCTEENKKFFAGKCVNTDEYNTLAAEQAAQNEAIGQIREQGNERERAVEERIGRYNTHSPTIKEKHSVLEEMRLQFDSSVWRDKEGKLNVARIVSDSVAGVALGTTGGVVINNMMKKNQVEDGFEDLKCKIGTEVVAEWGEVFRAGQ